LAKNSCRVGLVPEGAESQYRFPEPLACEG
jgi:hypothetical protein